MNNNTNWTVDRIKEGWDYDRYHIAATNKHDHSEVINLPRTTKVPQSRFSQIWYWIKHPLTPYKGIACIVRDSLAHRMAYLTEREKDGSLNDFANANNFEAFLIWVDSEEQFEKEMSTALERLSKRANYLARNFDVDGLRKLYEYAMLSQVEPRFRDRWKKEVDDIKEQYERLLPDEG